MDSKYVWFVFIFSLINLGLFVGTFISWENMVHVDNGSVGSSFGVKLDSKWHVVSNSSNGDASTVKYNDNENNVLLIEYFKKNKDD
ncbi:MAG: hypothetical protein LBD03_01375 [Methanobrevibacter sp.]|jgi:hypothetical protein|nr:hypothetical protein [Candidatus Methanovirga procula]